VVTASLAALLPNDNPDAFTAAPGHTSLGAGGEGSRSRRCSCYAGCGVVAVGHSTAADALHAVGVDEQSRGLLAQRWPEFASQPDPDRWTRTGSPGELEKARQTVAALARHADHGRRRATPEPGQPATPDQRAHDAAGSPGPLAAVLERIRGRQAERAAYQREAGRGRSRRGPARPPARSQTWNAEVYMNLYSADRHAQEPAGHSRLTRPLQDV